MHLLLDYPECGPVRDDLFPGCRNLVVEQYLVIYRIADNEIIVGRALHSSQDPASELAP